MTPSTVPPGALARSAGRLAAAQRHHGCLCSPTVRLDLSGPADELDTLADGLSNLAHTLRGDLVRESFSTLAVLWVWVSWLVMFVWPEGEPLDEPWLPEEQREWR